ncbi:hypothetical protein [Nostoc favosum]|uniref:Uncharacterized protein n=1 Tax=Nostoc favosum CHAB5714 TaxID=2780399 RepID=A0ABS8IN02_9NOSO|nr:hypothetical protein [Nostoc favosum]MCC5605144.1 hypothetical protein [Nostoc favosum CHAB5714]
MRENCQFCGGEFRLKVVSDRQTKTKYLRAGCCDSPLRPCPNVDELLRSANLTQDERDYLQRIANLDWFRDLQENKIPVKQAQ